MCSLNDPFWAPQNGSVDWGEIMWYVGFDPGGEGQFGWCVVQASDGIPPLRVQDSGEADHAAAAVSAALRDIDPTHIAGIGIDSPLFWSSKGDRQVDKIVRSAIRQRGAPNVGGTVQNVNSLRGACLVQGIWAARLVRDAAPSVPITESHPKALLWLIRVASGKNRVASIEMRDLDSFLTCQARDYSDHERDAALGALAAWAMVSRLNGWRDLFLEEISPFVPVSPVGYWMPIATAGVTQPGAQGDSPQAVRP